MESAELSGLYGALPCVVMAFTQGGELAHCNAIAKELMGPTDKDKITLADIFASQSAQLLKQHLNAGCNKNNELQEILEINSSYQFSLELLAQIRWWLPSEGEPLLILTAIEPKLLPEKHSKLEKDYRTLRSLIETSATPTWCIEYTEPVDLNVSDKEIIRQVFENDSHWYMCNKAMARLYDIPDDLDFNKQPVRMNFPRSPQNEAFIQELIDCGFFIDEALSVDSSHDGRLMYIANTVRPHIEFGMLHRMWGTSRDITQDKRKEAQLKQRENEMREVLSSVPDIILVVDEKLVLQGANPAFEKQLGWRIDDWLGKKLTQVVDLQPYTMQKKEMMSGGARRFVVPIFCADNKTRNFDASLAHFVDDLNGDRFVGVLRQVEV